MKLLFRTVYKRREEDKASKSPPAAACLQIPGGVPGGDGNSKNLTTHKLQIL